MAGQYPKTKDVIVELIENLISLFGRWTLDGFREGFQNPFKTLSDRFR